MEEKKLVLDPDSIGKRLKEMRRKKGYSQEYLAVAWHCKRESISKYEKGVNLITVDRLVNYMETFGKSAEYILFGEEEGKESLQDCIHILRELCDKLQ